jgi:hypothetical protein
MKMNMISEKCEHCRYYWNGVCEHVRAMYMAQTEEEAREAIKSIEECEGNG